MNSLCLFRRFFAAPLRFLAALFILSLCTACNPKQDPIKIQGFAQGTTYSISLFLPEGSQVSQSELEQAISAELARIDKIFSNYRDDSVIEQLNAQQTTAPIDTDAELVSLIETARNIHRASQGCYDLTIKPLFDLWGFKKDVFSPPSDEALAQTLTSVGLDKLETLSATQVRKQQPELRIDVSSIGQGYSVERLANLLRANFSIDNYMVEIGGEMQVRGHKPDGSPWRIAIEKPLPGERKMHKILSFEGGEPMAVMASGTYRHYFDSEGKRYSHILDARSGKPVEHNTVSATVLHASPSLADAWSTAFLCLGSEQGLTIANEQQIAVLFINQKGDGLEEIASQALDNIQGVSIQQP